MNLVCQWKIWGSGIFLDRSSEAGAADEGLDQHHRGASRACSKLVFFVVAFLLKSVSKRNDAWLCATSMPEDVAQKRAKLLIMMQFRCLLLAKIIVIYAFSVCKFLSSENWVV